MKCGENKSCGSGQYYAEWSQRWSDEQNSANADVRTLEERFKNQDSAAFAENKNRFDMGARGALGAEYEAAADRLGAANAMLSVSDKVRDWLTNRIDTEGEDVSLRQVDEYAATTAKSFEFFQNYIAPMLYGAVAWGAGGLGRPTSAPNARSPARAATGTRTELAIDSPPKLFEGKASPYSLEPTHGLRMGRNKMRMFTEQIREQGVRESIKFVEHNGTRYVVDGHHRLRAAKAATIEEVPVKQVELPYAGYKTVDDLEYQP